MIDALSLMPTVEAFPAGAEHLALAQAGLKLPRLLVMDDATGPIAHALRQHGVDVVGLHARLAIDLQAMRRFRRESGVRLWHVHGMHPLRWAMTATLGISRPRIIWHETGDTSLSFGAIERALLDRVSMVVIRKTADAQLIAPYSRADFVMIPPGALLGAQPVSHQEQRIATDGIYDSKPEWVTALRAFDFLKFLYPQLHLELSGSGRWCDHLTTYAQTIATSKTLRVRFIGPEADVATWFAASRIVWVASTQAGAVTRALTAMAQGRPVVAVRCPEMEKIIIDGETGLLFTPGDHLELSQLTRQFLDDPQKATTIGERAAAWVAEHFPTSRVVDGFRTLYHQANPSSR